MVVPVGDRVPGRNAPIAQPHSSLLMLIHEIYTLEASEGAYHKSLADATKNAKVLRKPLYSKDRWIKNT